ncbi:hypothetical protein BDZ97DRAFT_1841815 [Flammula alnicola]|nr:hypothetical protein BDZ97DRAFT_1841815 [Flammula alnicola]
MGCKGCLVEIIVLNIGLKGRNPYPRVFSMFVVHAMVLIFMTTPLVKLLSCSILPNTEFTTSAIRLQILA